MARVIGVVGGSGGVGASLFAAVLASVATGEGPALLLDLDVAGGGVDVVLGVESAPGARWSGLRLAGGRLEARVLLDGLLRWGGAHVLAADADEIVAADVVQVLDAVDAAVHTVVVDLPRHPCAERDAALARCDLVVVLARADVAGIVAAHAQVRLLPELPVGVLTRGGDVGADGVAELVGAPLVGRLPALAAGRAPVERRVPRTWRAVAAGVLAGLTSERVPA